MATKFTLAILMILLLDCTATSARSQSDEDAKFLLEVFKTTAFVQTYIDVCHERVPATDGKNQQAYAAWQKRNQWEALSIMLKGSEPLRKIFEQNRQSARDILSKMNNSGLSCQTLPSRSESIPRRGGWTVQERRT